MKKKLMPKLKKKVSSFLSSEDGKITKESVLKTGALLGTMALVPALTSAITTHSNSTTTPQNTLRLQYAASTGDIQATHSNIAGSHANHVNHASHSSHGSHGSHNSW